ncbi:bifunctional riboflavin kinase/FAD synthetase [Marinilabiliaceae bacterium JC017]|nr:bifunctional riboflavin kinase/FAD synthetase [Marinilabiliaceae bacterium JC017]
MRSKVVKVHAGLNDFSAQKAIVTIGMFDGIHAGHKALLKHVMEEATKAGGESVVLSFWPHPRVVLNKDAEKLRFLTSLEEKTRLIAETGIDHLILLPFTKELSQKTAEEFIEEILVKQIKVHHLVVGYNHRFGKGRQHNFEHYQAFARKFNFEISRVDPVEVEGLHTSSSTVRQYLSQGNIRVANTILGYHYQLSGRVIGGQRLGRKLGFPTANIQVGEPSKLVPPDGVYACRVTTEGKQYMGMLNIGYRPTVNHNVDHRSIEVHILDFNQDIYSEEILVEFIDKLRDEKKFDNLEELQAQLKNDENNTRQTLNHYFLGG